MMIRWLSIAKSLLAVLVLTGCSQDMSDLEVYIADVNKRPARPLEPIPEIAPYEPAAYAALELRDPFVPNEIFNPTETEVAKGDNTGPRPILDRKKEPLEGFPIDSLRMVGTLNIAAVQYALVRSSEPIIYRVREGDYLGQNHGRVIAVNETELRLSELFPDGAGRWVQRETSMGLSSTLGATK